jgi:tetratricopeptide (TPR) repeat protein
MTALAGIYEGLALSLQQTGQFARALNYAQKGLRIFETVRDVRMAAQLRHNMADMLLQQGRAEEAERLFAEGADHLRRIADAELLPHLVSGMAESALERDDIPRAAVLIDEAVDLASRSTDPLAAAHAHRVAGRVFHRRGAKHQGRRHFERALEIARTVESPDLLGRITYDFARALEEEGDTVGAALRYREAYEAGRVATRQSLPLSQDLA